MEQEKMTQPSKKRRVPAILDIILFLVIWICFMMVIGILCASQWPEIQALKSGYTYIFISIGISIIASLGTTFIVMKFIDRCPLLELGLSFKGRGKDLLLGALIAFIILVVGMGISLATGIVKIVGFQFPMFDLILTFLLCALISVSEEVMMRGYILRRLLQTRLNRFVSLLISASLFAMLHLFNPNVALFPMINLVIAGCLLGAAYIYTRNLWFPLSLHLFWNWIQGPILGYEVSGQTISPSILKLQLPVKNMMNGGDFGFEGSIICTVLTLTATGLIIWHFERKKATPSTVGEVK